MPLDHYLPATYIARFSNDLSGPRRNRRVWAVDKRSGRAFQTSAGNLCAENDFYTISHNQPRIVDDIFSVYEGSLSESIDNLITRTIDALAWAQTLVPFASGLLVRGRDFDQRFARRLFIAFGAAISSVLRGGTDNTNLARLMEMQRLQASVLGAKWTVVAAAGGLQQITNDLAFNAHLESSSGSKGIAIPIGLHHIVTIIPTTSRHVVAIGRGGKWYPKIEYATMTEAQQDGFNHCLATSAQRFLIGPDEAAVARYANRQNAPPQVPEPSMLGFMSGAMARQYEHTYARLLTALDTPPSIDGEEIYVDFEGNISP